MKPLCRALRHEDAALRRNAAWALALSSLLEVLADKGAHEQTRVSAAGAFEEAVLHFVRDPAPLRPTVIPLCEMLKDETARIRLNAVTSLGAVLTRIGDQTALNQGMPSLLATLKDEKAEVRRGAVFALGWVAGHIKDKSLLREAVPALKQALEDEDEQVRAEAGTALRKIQEPAANAAADHSARQGEPG